MHSVADTCSTNPIGTASTGREVARELKALEQHEQRGGSARTVHTGEINASSDITFALAPQLQYLTDCESPVTVPTVGCPHVLVPVGQPKRGVRTQECKRRRVG